MRSNVFDVRKEREELESPTGFALSEAANPADFAKNRNLCTGAQSSVGVATRGLLVGMDQRSLKLLQSAHQWLERSVEIGEEGTYAGGKSGIHETLALTRWLLTGDSQVEEFRKSLQFQTAVMNERKCFADSFNADAAAALCVHAQARDDAARLRARFEAESGERLERSPKTPRGVGYAIAESVGSGTEDMDALLVRGTKLLRRYLNDWISHGQYVTSLSWLKIVHWDLEGRARSPVDVVKKALDYLKTT